MKEYKTGDIVVSLANTRNGRKYGDIISMSSYQNYYYSKKGVETVNTFSSSYEKETRLARSEEIEAYSRGIRNIKNITLEIINDYQIY